MAQVGGYRPTAPQNNFAVSATGGAGNGGQAPKYVAGMPYGEGADFMDLQSMAPMEASAGGPSASSVGAAPSQLAQQRSGRDSMAVEDINLVPLSAPSQRPNEPVTTGVDAGPGAGSDVLQMNTQFQNPYSLSASLQPLLEHDTTGDIAMLYRLAVNRGW